MPVIELPPDTRWSTLGAGLGNLLGSALQGYEQRQATQGIVQIQNDPSIPDTQKFSTILQKYGDRGAAIYTQMAKMDLLRQQTQEASARAGELLANTRLQGLEADTKAAGLPLVVPAAQAKIAHEQAGTAQEQATAGLRAAQTANEPLIGARTLAQTGEATAQTDKINIEAQQLAAAPQTQGAPAGFDVGAATRQLIPGATPEQLKAAEFAYQSGANKPKGSHAEGLGALQKYAATQNKAPSEPAQKVALGADAAATDMEQFMQAFNRDPAKFGLTSGAPILTWAEGHGIPTGNPQLVEAWTSAARTVASQARNGSVFMSNNSIKLARDITPGVLETPLHALSTVYLAAKGYTSQLEEQKALLGSRVDTTGIDREIDRWHKIEADARYDYWEAHDASGKPLGTSVMVWHGDQVDPKTLKPLLRGSGNYKATAAQGALSVPGLEVIARAQAKGVDPRQWLAAWRASQQGAQP